MKQIYCKKYTKHETQNIMAPKNIIIKKHFLLGFSKGQNDVGTECWNNVPKKLLWQFEIVTTSNFDYLCLPGKNKKG